jgi:hypothetical protein
MGMLSFLEIWSLSEQNRVATSGMPSLLGSAWLCITVHVRSQFDGCSIGSIRYTVYCTLSKTSSKRKQSNCRGRNFDFRLWLVSTWWHIKVIFYIFFENAATVRASEPAAVNVQVTVSDNKFGQQKPAEGIRAHRRWRLANQAPFPTRSRKETRLKCALRSGKWPRTQGLLQTCRKCSAAYSKVSVRQAVGTFSEHFTVRLLLMRWFNEDLLSVSASVS